MSTISIGGPLGGSRFVFTEGDETSCRRATLQRRITDGLARDRARADARLREALAPYATREAIEGALAPVIDGGAVGISVCDGWLDDYDDKFNSGVLATERSRIEQLTDGDYTLLAPDDRIVLGVNPRHFDTRSVVFNTSRQYRYRRACDAATLEAIEARLATIQDRVDELYYAPGERPCGRGALDAIESARAAAGEWAGSI
jgi:hypothetical protein